MSAANDGDPRAAAGSQEAGTREAPAAQTRYAQILDTAAGLFSRKGYEASSTREIATLVGIQRASLYHHFAGKEELLFAISMEGLRRINLAVVDAARAEPDASRLQAIIRAHLKSAIENVDMHSVMLTEMRALSGDMRDSVVARRAEYEQFVRAVIDEDQTAGRIRNDISAEVLALALLNLLNWTIFWVRTSGTSVDDLASDFGRIFFEGVEAPRGARQDPQPGQNATEPSAR